MYVMCRRILYIWFIIDSLPASFKRLSLSLSESGGETDDSDEFFDAELGEWSQPVGVVMTSPSLSVPLEEGDPSDIEEEQDLVEEDDTAGVCVCVYGLLTSALPPTHTHLRWRPGQQECDNAYAVSSARGDGPHQDCSAHVHP